MASGPDRANTSIAVEAARVRKTLGRSGPLVHLFDFLLARPPGGPSPKEIEIAQEVFGKTIDFDMVQDASVRVYVHRLRRKIDDFYRGSVGPRLSIPKGEYRLTLEEAVPDEEVTGDLPPGHSRRPAWSRAPNFWRWSALVAALLTVNIGVWLWIVNARPPDPNRVVADTSFWKALKEHDRPPFVVTGDYYIFGDAPDDKEVTRLVRQFSINSRDDLDEYLMVHPEERGRLIDVNLHYLPASTARALGDVLPVVNAAASVAANKPWVLTSSELTPESLKGVNIVYVGFLSGLGILRDPLFEASGFSVGASYDELVDRASGKHYTSDWGSVADNQTPHRDYAYLASVPGAAGNRVLVVAGTRDAGVMQAAEVARDKAQLDQIARRVGGQASFEALYEVRTLGNVNLSSRLILARPLRSGQVGKIGSDRLIFPDQISPADKTQP